VTLPLTTCPFFNLRRFPHYKLRLSIHSELFFPRALFPFPFLAKTGCPPWTAPARKFPPTHSHFLFPFQTMWSLCRKVCGYVFSPNHLSARVGFALSLSRFLYIPPFWRIDTLSSFWSRSFPSPILLFLLRAPLQVSDPSPIWRAFHDSL